jgi:hypothetical protein
MIKANYFNAEDLVLEYGYEHFRDPNKTHEQQVLHIAEKILELQICIYDNEHVISLQEAKMAAEFVKTK